MKNQNKLKIKSNNLKRNYNKYYMTLSSILLVFIYITSIPAQASIIGESNPQNVVLDRLRGPVQLSKKVLILYDPENELFAPHAESIYASIHMVYLNTELVPITSLKDLNNVFKRGSDTYIMIWAFDTNLEGILFADIVLNWKTVVNLVAGSSEIEHVLGVGNVEEFLFYMNQRNVEYKNFHYQPTVMGVMDLKIEYFFTVWTVAEIFETFNSQSRDKNIYNLAGETLKNFALRFFEVELNDLMNRQVEPKTPVGELNETLKQEKFDELKKDFPIERTGLTKIDRQRGITPPLFFKSNVNTLQPSDILLAILPEESGLQGPIGFILDFLFEVMNDKGDGDVYISEETLDVIWNAFQVIKSLIGGDGLDSESASSALKGLLDLLLNEFPFGEQLLPYMHLMIDGLFALKGDVESISNFIESLLDTVLPEMPPAIRGAIDLIINMTGDVITRVQEGQNFLTALGGVLTENLVGFFIDKLLNETLGIPTSLPYMKPGGEVGYVANAAYSDLRNKLDVIIQMVIDIVTGNKDIVEILRENIASILIDVFGFFDETKRNDIQKLADTLAFGYSLLNTEQSKLLDRVKEYLTSLLPDSISNKAQKIEETANNIVNAIGSIREGGTDSWAPMKTLLDDALDLLEPHITDPKLFTLITKAMEWIFAVLNDKLTDPQKILAAGLEDVLTAFFDWANILPTATNQKPAGVLSVTAVPDATQLIKYALGIYSLIKEGPERAQELFSQTVNGFKEDIEKDPIGTLFTPALQLIFGENASIVGKLESFGELILGTYKIIARGELNSFESIMQLLIAVAGTGIFELFDIDIDPILAVIQNIFPDIFNLANAPSPTEAVNQIINLIEGIPGVAPYVDIMRTVLNIIIGAREIFTNGIQWLFSQIIEWLGRQVEELVNSLLESLIGSIGGSAAVEHNMASGKPMNDNTSVMNKGYLAGYGDRSKLTSDIGAELISYKIPAEFGGFSLFELEIFVGLKPNFGFDTDGFKQLLVDMIFKGKKLFGDDGDIGDFFAKLFSFFEITPVITAGIEIGNMASGKNDFFSMLLKTLGLKIAFQGKGWFAMNLFTIKGGEFKFDNFLKIIEWGLKFTITLSKELTLLDFLTAGVGGGVLNAVAEFLGLGGIKVIISIGLSIEIIKRAASDTKPEEATFTLEIIIGVVIDLAISLVIVGIHLWGGLEITLTFFQDLASDKPLQIFLKICFFFGVALTFLFFDFGADFEWCPIDTELTPSSKEEQEENGAKGFDVDKDGLSDEYEDITPGLNKNSADSDGDGLTDKQETQYTKTDPSKADTDGDGLSDKFEIEDSKTDPLNRDSDYDGLTDFDEVQVYKTNPNQRDTDGDGLDDNFEVNHAWNITEVTPTVFSVRIGNKDYNDHTDPLNPDTDGDGLLDGQEGERGPWYGSPDLRREGVSESADLIVGGGYTHPLDSDTDDDSYEQIVNGTKSFRDVFLRDMSDKVEIEGILVDFWVDGEPELRLFRTNPVRPDSDGDTGYTFASPEAKANAPINIFLNSDGYELSLTPPTDPLDGDTDDDGLMDGLEGTLFWASNRTNPNNADTDGDGLGDLLEILLGSSPLDVDTDNDMVSDGDEYLIYGTSVFLDDTDHDGVLDGQELFWFHTNPFLYDSDGDGIGDAAELFDYFTDPMDDDTDRDGLTDYEEIMIYLTVPNNADTDDDGLLDGFEIKETLTDPFIWDTDNDSILYFDPTSPDGIAWKWGDYEEYMAGSDPTSSDTDKDGLEDGWEAYLGSGRIPNFTPLPLNFTNKDTDGDGLLDGQEIMIKNQSSLIYPFTGYYLIFPFNSSPVMSDTDLDGLDDRFEVMVLGTKANVVDTDNDTLTDYEEYMFHNTNPVLDDTDGDGLLDYMELTNATLAGYPATSLYNTTFKVYINVTTNATDPDTDGDLLPDGAELFFYFNLTKYGINSTFDPLNPDQDGNGIIDGLDLDSDYDGLPDGYEFYGANYTDKHDVRYDFRSTYMSNAGSGGPLNPDSDYDSLPDGLEVFNLFTDPTNNDTDGDGFSDGLEERINTDPLVDTSWADFADAMNTFKFIKVASPVALSYVGKIVPIRVNAPEDSAQVSYQVYQKQSGTWTQETELNFDQGWNSWTIGNGYQLFEPGNYLFRTNIYYEDGSIETNEVYFAIQNPFEEFDIIKDPPMNVNNENEFGLVIIGLLAGLAVSIMITQSNSISNLLSRALKRKAQEKKN